MRALIIDKTAGLDASHERHQALARIPGIELHVLGPRHWIENRRPVLWTPASDCEYRPHLGAVFGKDYYARAGYYHGLIRALRRSKPDIIQLLEEPWSIAAGQTLLAARLFAPSAHILFYTWENIARGWDYPSRAAPIYRCIDRASHTYSSGALCATDSARQVLLGKGYSHPVEVVAYGIPNFFFSEAPCARPRSASRPVIGYIGRLLRMKGVDLLLEAAATIPDAGLLIVGSGEDEVDLRERAQCLSVMDRIEWLPPQPEAAIPALMRRMDALVLPSRTTPGWCEQLGRVLIEAMACGTPVIGARSGAIPEVIGDAGLLFAENDADELRQRLRQIIDDSALRERLRQSGYARARHHFTWDRFAAETAAFWYRIANP